MVIISIDGLRPDALSERVTPNILRLARRGSYTLSALTVIPSETTPGHASMLSGYTPQVHKVVWDDWKPENGPITVPTVFSRARAAAYQSVMVVGKYKLRHMAPEEGTFVCATRGDDVVNEAVVRALLPFDILFVHLPSVDLVGHAKGWMTTEYLTQLAYTDQALARLLAVVPANATVILTADHGGDGLNHGASAAPNLTIPWIIAGPGIVPGRTLTTPVRTMDTAATTAAILGFSLRADAVGKVVTEAIATLFPSMPDIFVEPGNDGASSDY